ARTGGWRNRRQVAWNNSGRYNPGMKELRSWLVCGWKVLRFLAYRAGWARPPSLTDVFDELLTVLGGIGKWPVRCRTLFPERCPQSGPAIFVGNHLRFDDPQLLFNAIFRATNQAVRIRYMMRHDFFKGVPFSEALGLNDFFIRMGAFMIDRDRVTIAQLKPFVTLLREEQPFGMFPGGTRSRTGLFFEYRDGIAEPGGISFFVAQTQRAKPNPPVPTIPVVRTWNPANQRSTLIFGEALYLEPGADRAAQRRFDSETAYRMGDLIELNAAQLVATILYLRCLHRRTEPVRIDAIVDRVRRIAAAATLRFVEPATRDHPAEEVHAALAHFESRGLVRRSDGAVELAAAEILACPPQDKRYVRHNPVKYLVNQILHLCDVTQIIEKEAL
ncbi:MAG TPA: lysophospholipid acyltransferase family protein, partial [Candidatus Hydrogenedentes bacterium]|nr:lysophospholipid acyltransferase family protein [Candidatus Hydrogenedentota bacterium]